MNDVSVCVQLDVDDCRDHVEVCPDAGIIAAEIADRIAKYHGFALIADYGHNGEKTDTFRVSRWHRIITIEMWKEQNSLKHL